MYLQMYVHVLYVCMFIASNLLNESSHQPTAVFPHTLWLAPLTGFGNVCLLSLVSLHLEHAPGKLPDLCAVRLVLISCASALLGPMRMVQLSVLCHREARAVISALDSPAITSVHFPNNHWWLAKETFSVFTQLFISSCLLKLVFSRAFLSTVNPLRLK